MKNKQPCKHYNKYTRLLNGLYAKPIKRHERVFDTLPKRLNNYLKNAIINALDEAVKKFPDVTNKKELIVNYNLKINETEEGFEFEFISKDYNFN